MTLDESNYHYHLSIEYVLNKDRYIINRYIDDQPIQCLCHLEGDFYLVAIAGKDHLILWERDPIDPTKDAKGGFKHKLKIQKDRQDEQEILKIRHQNWKNQKFGAKYITFQKLDDVRNRYQEELNEILENHKNTSKFSKDSSLMKRHQKRIGDSESTVI